MGITDDFFHYYVEEITKDIITPMEYELSNRGLTEEQQKEVIKNVMMWLLAFVWAKGEKNEKKDY